MWHHFKESNLLRRLKAKTSCGVRATGFCASTTFQNSNMIPDTWSILIMILSLLAKHWEMAVAADFHKWIAGIGNSPNDPGERRSLWTPLSTSYFATQMTAFDMELDRQHFAVIGDHHSLISSGSQLISFTTRSQGPALGPWSPALQPRFL